MTPLAAQTRWMDATGQAELVRRGEASPGELLEAAVERIEVLVTAVDYALALGANAEFRRSVQHWWSEGWDLLLTPTLGEPPAAISTFANDPDSPLRPLARCASYGPFTPAFNASGQPAISLPMHWTADGLPVGVQLVAAYGREDILIRVAAQLEAALPWAHRRPPIG